nr:hypothetical protein HUO10_002919 [Paraburkholderia busanensis]
MLNFQFDILSNLALLAIVLIACSLYNRCAPGATVSGARVFIALACVAILLDAALTFLVFADAQSRYGQFGKPSAFLGRAVAYGLAILAALIFHRIAYRHHPSRRRAGTTVIIRTSPYSESHLPM